MVQGNLHELLFHASHGHHLLWVEDREPDGIDSRRVITETFRNGEEFVHTAVQWEKQLRGTH